MLSSELPVYRDSISIQNLILLLSPLVWCRTENPQTDR